MNSKEGDNCTGVPESAEDDSSTRQTDDNGGLEVDDCSSTDSINDSTDGCPTADVTNVTTEVDDRPVVDTGNNSAENDCHSAETDCGRNIDSSNTEKESNVQACTCT